MSSIITYSLTDQSPTWAVADPARYNGAITSFLALKESFFAKLKLIKNFIIKYITENIFKTQGNRPDSAANV